MSGLKEIRTRITSVNSTMQITSAMKMVSAAKLRRAQEAITKMRPYAEKFQEILVNVSGSLDASEGIYAGNREVKKVLIVSIVSNRGLCGGFNNNVIKQVRKLISEQGKVDVKVLSLGKKSFESFKKTSYHTTAGQGDTPYAIFDDLHYDHSSKIAESIMKQYEEGEWDKVYIVYNRFKNAALQVVTTEQFLPVVAPQETASTQNLDYIFEPSKVEIVNEMIPRSLKIQLFKALLDSNASEHGARMTAMHAATDNASELKKELLLYYNKARQAAITNEILEIVGGAEALKG